MSNQENEDFEDRVFILKMSPQIEHSISEYLAQLLGVQDFKNSNSFGSKSSALSFNHKVNLLLDVKALEKESKQVLITFMEIRNHLYYKLFNKNTVIY